MCCRYGFIALKSLKLLGGWMGGHGVAGIEPTGH